MRIALCLEYPVGQFGGTEVLVSCLIEGFSGQHEVVLVSPDDAASLARSRVGGMIAGHIQLVPPLNSPAKARAMARAIAATKPDIVHFHFGGNYAWGNRVFWNCPVFYLDKNIRRLSTNHGAFSIFDGYCWDQRSWLVRMGLFPPAWLSKQVVLAQVDCEVAVSQHDYHALRRWYPALKNRFRWIYHSRIHADAVPDNVPMEQRRRVVLCVGTIGSRKTQPLLVEAFGRVARKFPDWQLVLVGRTGDPAMMAEIERLAGRHTLGSQFRYLGECSDAEVESWLKHAAVFAMPSRYEGLGLSLQEAQFHGCACVATRCGGPEDLIEDGENGLLVPVDDPGKLAVALERLMGDEALRRRLSLGAPRSVLEKNMTVAKMVRAYEDLYAGLINRSPGAT
jgi:glycosyltransferase involved in cell wall biosynthesis